MENDPNNMAAYVTRADLKAEFGAFEEKMEQFLSEQANVILDAVDERMGKNMERMEKKLDEKIDPVINKLDGILKGVEDLKQENFVGAKQLRRLEDRVTKLETAAA